MSTRYLLQIDQGYVYIYTEALAAKPDFREIGEEEAMATLKRFNNKDKPKPEKKEKIEEPVIEEPIVVKAPEASKAEEAVMDEEDIDPVVLQIRNMKSKNDVEDFMLEKFEIDIDRRKSISELKSMALEEYEKSNGK